MELVDQLLIGVHETRCAEYKPLAEWVAHELEGALAAGTRLAGRWWYSADGQCGCLVGTAVIREIDPGQTERLAAWNISELWEQATRQHVSVPGCSIHDAVVDVAEGFSQRWASKVAVHGPDVVDGNWAVLIGARAMQAFVARGGRIAV